RSEEHTSELQSHLNLVCRLLLEKKKTSLKHLAGSHRHGSAARNSDTRTHSCLCAHRPSRPPRERRAMAPISLSFFFLMIRRPQRSTLFPYTTPFRSTQTHTHTPGGVSACQGQISRPSH